MAARSWCLWVWIKLAGVLLLFSACLNTFFLYTYSPQKHQGHFFHSRPSILDHVIASTVPMKRKFITTPKQVESLAEWFCYCIVCLCFLWRHFNFWILESALTARPQQVSKSRWISCRTFFASDPSFLFSLPHPDSGLSASRVSFPIYPVSYSDETPSAPSVVPSCLQAKSKPPSLAWMPLHSLASGAPPLPLFFTAGQIMHSLALCLQPPVLLPELPALPMLHMLS